MRLAFVSMSYTRQRDGISVYLENLLLELYRHALTIGRTVEIDVFIGRDVAELLERTLADRHRDAAGASVRLRFIILRRTGLAKYAEISARLWRSRHYHLLVLPNPQPLIGAPGQRTLTVFHDFTYRAVPSQFKWRRAAYLDFLTRLRLRRDAYIGYISDTTLEQLLRFYPRAIKRHRLATPNGVPAKLAALESPSRGQLAGKFQASIIEMLFVGRVNRLKGVDRIISICRSLERSQNADGRHFILHVVGKDTSESANLLANLNFKNIEVHRHGYVPDNTLNELYRRSAFCFFLSRNEGFGLPLIEAIWLGCIPILSDIPIFREVMTETYPMFADDGGAGDEQAAQFIGTALADRTCRKRLLGLMQSTLDKHRGGYRRAAVEIFNCLLDAR